MKKCCKAGLLYWAMAVRQGLQQALASAFGLIMDRIAASSIAQSMRAASAMTPELVMFVVPAQKLAAEMA